MKSVLGSLSFNQAHNEWLQCLWQGGIILFVILVLLLITIAGKINRIQHRNLRFMCCMFFISVFIEMAFEVWLGLVFTWLMLLLIYKAESIQSEVGWMSKGKRLIVTLMSSGMATAMSFVVSFFLTPSLQICWERRHMDLSLYQKISLAMQWLFLQHLILMLQGILRWNTISVTLIKQIVMSRQLFTEIQLLPR